MNLDKLWRIYKLEKESPKSSLEFRSIEYEQDSEKWETLSIQVFEKDGNLYLSVLWLTE